jgi:hypothetical protein
MMDDIYERIEELLVEDPRGAAALARPACSTKPAP